MISSSPPPPPPLSACSELGFLVVWLVRVMLIPVLLPALGIVGGLVAARGFVSRAPPRAVLAKICNTPRDVRWLFAQARLTVFIFYPSVTYEIFSVFDCRSLGEESYLASSMTTSCGKVGSSMSGSYYLSLLLALALAAAWTVGVPVGMALYARSKMKALEGARCHLLPAAICTRAAAGVEDRLLREVEQGVDLASAAEPSSAPPRRPRARRLCLGTTAAAPSLRCRGMACSGRADPPRAVAAILRDRPKSPHSAAPSFCAKGRHAAGNAPLALLEASAGAQKARR